MQAIAIFLTSSRSLTGLGHRTVGRAASLQPIADPLSQQILNLKQIVKADTRFLDIQAI